MKQFDRMASRFDRIPEEFSETPEEDEEEEEEEEPKSLWGQFVNNMHGGRRGRNHEGRPQHGGRHHGGKHPRGPPPPMEDDEEESFYGQPPRPPMRPRVQSERGPSQGHHGRHGKHGHHGRARLHRLGRVMHVLAHVFALALFAGHFYFIYQLKKAQVAEEKICGKKECGWRKWKCGGKKAAFQQPVVAQQPVVVEYSPVI